MCRSEITSPARVETFLLSREGLSIWSAVANLREPPGLNVSQVGHLRSDCRPADEANFAVSIAAALGTGPRAVPARSGDGVRLRNLPKPLSGLGSPARRDVARSAAGPNTPQSFGQIQKLDAIEALLRPGDRSRSERHPARPAPSSNASRGRRRMKSFVSQKAVTTGQWPGPMTMRSTPLSRILRRRLLLRAAGHIGNRSMTALEDNELVFAPSPGILRLVMDNRW